MNDYVPELERLFERQQMNMQQTDIEARVLSISSTSTALSKSMVLGRQGTADPAHAKMRYQFFVRRLQPEVLRREIERLAQVTHRYFKTDGIDLYELVVHRAKPQHQAHLLHLKLRGTHKGSSVGDQQESDRATQQRDCTVSTEQEKGDAHQKHVRSCMEQRGDHLKHLNEGNGLNNLLATVGGVIEMPLCHGPGPNHNVVPRHVVEQLQRLDGG
ncbi:hypothetical protein PC128_g5986 [Phytophthora cactorum]|nr:hypothetical protein PC128_g5986 [Phytophthora cactorum]